MSRLDKPKQRPAIPNFSSGPCAKRPGWTPQVLSSALLGRSHRSPAGIERLRLAIDKTQALLELPADYRLAIVPGSDTGAFEMALWSMLGERGVDVLAWEDFGQRWVADIVGELKPADTRVLDGRLRAPARSRQRRLRSRRGLHLERHGGGRARAGRRLDRRRPSRSHFRRCDVGAVRAGRRLAQNRRRHLLLAKGARRGSGARHDRAVAARHRAAAAASPELAGSQALPSRRGRARAR